MAPTDESSSGGPPRVSRVLETVLYFTDEERTEAFYSDVLGFRLMDRERGRSLFYRAGASVLLLFHAERSRVEGTLPPHGARGAIHTCFQVPRADYEGWKSHLAEHGVALLREKQWPRGRSVFFGDPDGNLLELADADIWAP